MSPTPQPLVNEHCQTGENPFYHALENALYWSDIPAGKIFRLDLQSGQHDLIYHDIPVGGFTWQSDGNWLLFRVSDIAQMSPDFRVRSLLPFQDAGAKRFNDVIADPTGRVFAGTIGQTKESGALWQIERDGTQTLLFRGTGVANGMGFSPDEKTFYWTCSTSNRIFRFDYDAQTGNLSNRALFAEVPREAGMPDGLTIDARGHIWSARNKGFCLAEYAPDGRELRTIPFPVAKVNSLCFGGPALQTIFATTGGGAPELDTPDGTLYELHPGVQGKAEFCSRILTP